MSEKTSYTTGPWTYERRGWEGQYIWGNDERIPGPDKRRFIADVSLAYDGAEENARLIAAAPDLLEALMRCKFDSLNMTLADLEFCRAAVRKATTA